jgi:hypothetical protein
MKKETNFSGKYSSIHEFIEKNNLQKEATNILGKDWEADDDIAQVKEILDSIDKEYNVTHIEAKTKREQRADDYIHVFKNENIWSEIKADHTDEETGLTHVDAWDTPDEDDNGKTIAWIDERGTVTYNDERAKTDKYAQEIITEAIIRIDDERHELVDKVIEKLKQDFRDGDYTVIDEILVHNVSMSVLRNSLPED